MAWVKTHLTRLFRHVGYGAANICLAIGLALTAFTFTPLAVAALLLLLGLSTQRNRDRLRLIIPALIICVSVRFAYSPDSPPTGIALPETPGQYSARSVDLMGLISVRAVIRPGKTGNVLVFVEANTLPFSGLDEQSLEKEIHRVLEAQGIPEDTGSNSDELTALLFYTALASAMHPTAIPEEIECPKGISAPETFWSMYPAEFSHTCSVSNAGDGRYWGQSSAEIPVTARLDVKAGRIENISFQGPLSPYGQRAADTMRERMLGQSTVGVDVVSGATQTAYAVRSAANAACIQSTRLGRSRSSSIQMVGATAQ